MPNLDPSQIRVAGTGALWKAPVGTPLPTDSTTAWNAAFTHLGYASTGFTVTQNLKTVQVTGWQSTEPLLNINQSLSRSISFESLESDKQNLSLAFGGATVNQTATASGGAVTFSTGTITTASAHGFAVGNVVFFTGVTGTPGVTSGTNYFVVAVGSPTTLSVSATQNGAPIAISTGSATAVTNAGPFSVLIPDSAIAQEFTLGVDWSHGSYSQRFVIPRASLSTLPTIKYVRDDAIRYAADVLILKPLDGSQSFLPYGADWAASS